MEDFLKAIWTDEFNITNDVKEVNSVFVWSKKNKDDTKKHIKTDEDKKEKELRKEWYITHNHPWFSFIYRWKDWFYYKFFCKRQRFINSFLKKHIDEIDVYHYRPVESCSQAQVVANRKRKKYKTPWWYVLSDEFFALLCTYTK